MTDDRDANLAFEPGRCVNCGSTEITLNTPLYCSPRCRQSAELVRYVRRHRKNGTDANPDVVEVIRTRMAMVLGGGYPEQQRRVPERIRQLVFKRAGGRCRECGRFLVFDQYPEDPDSVATMQHVSGSSNDPDNLRAFCRRCNLSHAQSRFVPVEPGSAEAEYAMELRIRWTSETPLCICDDDTRWNDIWRDLTKEAKEVLQIDAEVVESGDDRDLPGFMGWTEQGTPIQEL